MLHLPMTLCRIARSATVLICIAALCGCGLWPTGQPPQVERKSKNAVSAGAEASAATRARKAGSGANAKTTARKKKPVPVEPTAEVSTAPANATAPTTATTPEAVERITLANDTLRVVATPDIGGRVLEFGLQGHPNFFKVGEAVNTHPAPKVDAQALSIPYLGHNVWLGPQSAWWQQQTVNLERLAEKAIWPPDPYLVMGKYQVIEQTASTLLLQSEHSPVSGVVMSKRISLDSLQPHKVHVNAEVKSVRSTSVAWGIWFNTRVHERSRIIVPVEAETDVSFQDHTDPKGRIPVALDSSYLFLEPEGRKGQIQGKYRIQPGAGWLAAVKDEQLFIIQFEKVSAFTIHPEQSQVEIYVNHDPANPERNFIEMEVHRPWHSISPGQVISASETWRILSVAPDLSNEQLLELIEKQVGDGL